MVDQSGATRQRSGLKVIGAGFGRTGTLSLKVALEELGLCPCYHMVELFKRPDTIQQWAAIARGRPADWHRVFEGYQATVDWPGCTFYKELMHAYPEAKVLLNVRDPEKWYESVLNTLYPIAKQNPLAPLVPMVNALVWEGTFDGKFKEKEYAIAVFREHIESVKQQVPPDKLLVYDVKEGWEPLCAFLGVEVPPEKPFPRLNDRTNFSGTPEEVEAALTRDSVSFR